MKKFGISTDSNSDLYIDEINNLNIYVGKLIYTLEKNGNLSEHLDDFKCYQEYVNFYSELKNGAVAKTAMLNLQSHIDLFTQMAEDGIEEVLHISQSQGLSPTIEAAKQAIKIVKEKYPNINFKAIESSTTTIGEGMLVKLACKLRDEGKSLDETLSVIENVKTKIQHFIIVDDLNYLKRGGRISGPKAMIGTLLNIKPIIEFTREGKLEIVRKEKGTKKALNFIVDEFNKFSKNKYFDITIVHTNNEPVANQLADMLEPLCGNRPEIRIMGPIIGAHVGPNAVAYGFISNEERPY